MRIPNIGPTTPHYPSNPPISGKAAFSLILLTQLSQLIENKLLNK